MAVYTTFAVQVLAITALAVFEQARGRQLAREISEFGGDPRAPGAEAVVGAVTLFAVLIMLVAVTTIAAVAAYLTWLIRARQHADPSRPAVTSVLAGWFVPVVNLIAPPMLVDRLWWASRPPVDRRIRWLVLLTAWWLSWLTALVLILVRLSPGTDQGSANLTGLGLTELAAVMIAALLCAATVRQITRIQIADARHGHPQRHRHRFPSERIVSRPLPQSVTPPTPQPVHPTPQTAGSP